MWKLTFQKMTHVQLREDIFFINIYLRCKNFQCSMGIRLLVRERYVHIYRQIASLLSATSLLRMSWSSCMLSDSYHIYVIVDGWFNCWRFKSQIVEELLCLGLASSSTSSSFTRTSSSPSTSLSSETGVSIKKSFLSGIARIRGGGIPMPEFCGPFSRSVFLVNKKSLFLQKCQYFELVF